MLGRSGLIASPARATLVLIAATLLLRAAGADAIGLGTGEAYYVASASQLHLSYFDQPPLSLWLAWLATQLFGAEDALLLRLPYVLIFAGSTWLIFRIGSRLHSPLAGFCSAVILNASALFSLAIGSWIQPDAPMVLFWLATCWFLIEVFFGEGRARPYRLWILVGLCLGLALLSKYHAIFILLGTALYMLCNRDARAWLRHPAPYLGVIIALAVFSPVLIWNAQNDWASFRFQGGRALVETGWAWHRLLRMVAGQLIYIVPWIAVPALVAGARALLAGPSGRFPAGTPAGSAALLAYIGMLPIGFFTLVSLWSETQYHFHWQAPGYMTLFLLLGAWAAELMRRHGSAVLVWLLASATATCLVLSLLLSHAATGWARAVFPGDWQDPTATFLPWDEVGRKLEALGAFERPRVFVAGLNWIECGYVANEVADLAPFACLGTDSQNLAFNADLQEKSGWDAFVVAQTRTPEDVVAKLETLFATADVVDAVEIKRGDVVEIRDIHIFEAKGFDFPHSGSLHGGRL